MAGRCSAISSNPRSSAELPALLTESRAALAAEADPDFRFTMQTFFEEEIHASGVRWPSISTACFASGAPPDGVSHYPISASIENDPALAFLLPPRPMRTI